MAGGISKQVVGHFFLGRRFKVVEKLSGIDAGKGVTTLFARVHEF